MLEIFLTREDANTEFALLAEWLVEDQEDVEQGQPVCVVETSKATVEIEAPGDGTLIQLYRAGAEVELGGEIALIAESSGELARLLESRARGGPQETASAPAGKATKKAAELAALHGIDLDSIEKRGFITAADVEGVVRSRSTVLETGVTPSLLMGVSTDGVTLPGHFDAGELAGEVDAGFLESVRADADAFRALPSDEKCDAYRRNGAEIGRDVILDDGVLLLAPRIIVEDEVRIGPGATVECEDIVAVGALTHIGANLEITCRRAFLGSNIHGGRSIRMGGGGHRDPWAIVAVGDLTFLGDETFINVSRPVLIGREVFVTQRSMLVTHNIGHSVLEGFENRFAPVILEDLSQVGLGAVVYAGCRVGRAAIVASNSYVVSDIPAGKLAVGVPARVAGEAHRKPSRPKQVELGRRMIDDLRELLTLRGHVVLPLEGELKGLKLQTDEGELLVGFVEKLGDESGLPSASGEAVVLTLEFAGTEVPDGYAVVDLLDKRIYGGGTILLDSVREFCRKKGIRLTPGPWRYRGGLI